MMAEFPDWTRAFVMMGDSPVGMRAVLLTEDGSMYALLQGEDADHVLHTVRLDDEGRLSAFIIDSTDAWGRMLSIGNAELAARLGSPVNYDRRGQVIFAESFETGWYRWLLSKSGNLAAGEITPTVAATGGYSVKLTGGNSTGWSAGISRIVPSRPVGRMGFEFSFCVPTYWDYILATLYLYTGAVMYSVEVKYTYATRELTVFDEFLGHTFVGTATAFGGSWFNTIKLVGDIDTGKYVRLMFNNQEIPLGARTVRVDDDVTTPPSIDLHIVLHSRDGFNDVMYLDDIILTGAEPE